jgi:RNase P subunit RPR2
MHAQTVGVNWRKEMSEKTCAACDYPLDENAIQVTIGGRTVEVCCEECAQKLGEAEASK